MTNERTELLRLRAELFLLQLWVYLKAKKKIVYKKASSYCHDKDFYLQKKRGGGETLFSCPERSSRAVRQRDDWWH